MHRFGGVLLLSAVFCRTAQEQRQNGAVARTLAPSPALDDFTAMSKAWKTLKVGHEREIRKKSVMRLRVPASAFGGVVP